MSQALCKLPVAILALAGVVVAKWNLVKQLEVSKPAHPYTFFGAKTAVTFTQLNVGLLKLRTGVMRGFVCGDARASGSVRVECWGGPGRYQYAPATMPLNA